MGPARPAGSRRGLVAGLGLDDATAATVRELVARPPDAAEPVTVVGLVLLVVSVLGFARSLQRTVEAAWDLPRSGLRGYGAGLLAAAVFVGDVVALVFLAELVSPLSSNVAAVTGVRAVAGAPGLVAGAAPARRRPGRWRDLLPGAVVAGVGQAVVMALASLILRPVLTSQAHRFGAIGVAFAMVTALTVLGVLMVVGAVLGPVVAGRVRPAQRRATA